jgi:hypothetical protein
MEAAGTIDRDVARCFGFLAAFAAGLEAYRRFAGASHITWPRRRPARELSRALRLGA